MTPSVAMPSIEQQQLSPRESPLARRLFLVLSAVALIYAFLAGLRTVEDFDLGWQMATGRWVIQHHQIPSVDVLSYTMPGQPWVYPIGGTILFYLAYVLGGFALISWIGAAACVGTVALLLRRGSAVSAAIAIISVPLIAARTTPRADMFTVVLFAAYLSLLWENYRTGRARLWWLPLLMIAWVNLHFGFASGIALVVAYVAAELLETVFGAERRRAAIEKLRRAGPWLLLTGLATLVNPWGWNIYHGLLVEQRAYEQGQLWINEWAPVPINWATVSRSLLLRQTGSSIYILLGIALVAAAIALLRGHWVAAVMLLGSMYPAVHAVRMGAVFACVVVVVGGSELWPSLAMLGQRIRFLPTRRLIASVAAAGFVVLAGLRSFDLITDRHYFATADEAVFGAGLCSWFPERAAEFIQRENVPPEILNTYAAGGFMSWRLGPQRRVYIDGRDTLYGPAHLARLSELTVSPPDSQAWQDETSRYNINTIILALARADSLQPALLRGLCKSPIWQPVYIDERAAVFVRQTPENQDLIRRFPVNCATAPIPADSSASTRAAAFNTWTNAAITLAALGRNSEAQAAYQKALAIFPDAAYLHRGHGDLLFAMGRMDESEQEYLTAIKLDPSADTWGALARSYLQRSRMLAAADAMEQEAQFSPRPFLTLNDLGYLYLSLNEPEQALKAFDRAERTTPSALKAADNGFFEFKVAQGQSAAWDALGNLEKATVYQEKAADLQPNVPQPWRRLAQLYEKTGRGSDAARAREHAAEVAQGRK
jgi:tetratricopeptide (TPR) repeat protein